jgi:peptidoglycan/LPS O-acetylase OafA/YrhL
MPHFRVLEFWRLSAAIAVMAFHFLRYAPEDQQGAADVLYRLQPLMDMFFMISGFLIMLRYGDTLLDGIGAYARFVLRRAARIYPVYLATLAFFVAIGLAHHLGYISSGWEHRFDFSVLPHNLLLIQAWGTTEHLTFNYVAWTLSAEWFCYLLFPVIVVAFRYGGGTGLAMLALATMALLEIASAYGIIPDAHWLETNSWGAFRAFADFAAGALVAAAMRGTSWTLGSHLPGWLVFASAIVVMLMEQDGYLVFALLAAAIYLSSLAERNNPRASAFLRPLQPVGQASFGIYLLHPVMEVVFFSIAWRMVVEPTGNIGFFTFWYLPMAATIAVAIASDRWFERPVGRAIVGWAERGRQARPGIAPAE